MPRSFDKQRRVYLEKQLVVLTVDARLGHSDSFLLVHLMTEIRQVDGVEVRALQECVQAVLGAQISLLLRGKNITEEHEHELRRSR